MLIDAWYYRITSIYSTSCNEPRPFTPWRRLGFTCEHTRHAIESKPDGHDENEFVDVDAERMPVPLDIMRFIFQHYANTMVWDVHGADFAAFTRKETLKGPCFEF